MTTQQYASILDEKKQEAIAGLRQMEVFVACLHELSKLPLMERSRVAENLFKHFQPEVR